MSKNNNKILVAMTTIMGIFSAATAPAESSAEQARTSVVIIVPLEQVEAAALVVQALQSQLSDLDVDLLVEEDADFPPRLSEQVERAEKLAKERGSIAVVWCDLSMESQIFLYLSEREANRILVRRIEETESGGRAESIAIIVRQSVDEILKGGKIGVEKKEPPKDAAPASVETEPENRAPSAPMVKKNKALSFAAGYVFSAVSGERPATHGIDLGLEARAHPNLAVFGSYTIFGPIDERGSSGSMRLTRHPARLGVNGVLPMDELEIGAGVALVVDWAVFEAMNLAAGLLEDSDKNDVVYYLAPSLFAKYRIVEKLCFFVSAGADIPLNPIYYRIETGTGDEDVLLDPWLVQPRVFVGFSVEVL